MRKATLVSLAIFWVLCGKASAQRLDEIFKYKNIFDGKEVEVEGVLIGDIIKKRESVFVNLKSGSYFIGLYIPYAQAKEIKFSRRFSQEPDYVKVRGVFHKECPQHLGATDIHVEELTVLKRGRRVMFPFPKEKLIFVYILGGVALFFAVINLFRRHARR